MKKNHEKFSKLGFILAGLGMAVGTGNIWRFPRVVSSNGGGAFIIPWLVFLFLWSLPLLIIEFGIGNTFQSGIIQSFKKGISKKFVWMGSFIAWVSTAILFYYSVVTGWCLKYFFSTIISPSKLEKAEIFWENFTLSKEPILFHAIAIFFGSFIVYKGVIKGIERTNKIFMPLLLFLLTAGVVKSFFTNRALDGFNYLFSPNLSLLGDYKIWLNALTQAAWSTGAGWGLMLTYAIYASKKDDPVLSSSTLAFGDYTVSLLAGMIVVPSIFAVLGSTEKVLNVLNSGNQGLTFIWLPTIFRKLPLSQIVLPLFFLSLFFAAFTSLISLIELPVRILIDTGIERKKAVIAIGLISFTLGIPSALSMKFFNNQDWTWGLGLILSGFFFSFFVIKYGVKKFREDIIEKRSSVRVGKFFDIIVKYIIPLEFIIILSWWFYNSTKWDKWYNIFGEYSLLSVVLQWALFLGTFILFNKKIGEKFNDEN